MPRNYLLAAGHGAGAKNCLGPAPLEIINSLNVRYLCFSGGASPHKKSAPAPSENHVEVKLMLSIGNRSIYVSVHVLMGFRGVNVIPVPFTPRFGVFSCDYWTFGSVFPTIWLVFVGLLDLRVRLPHVLTCFRGVNVVPIPFTP